MRGICRKPVPLLSKKILEREIGEREKSHLDAREVEEVLHDVDDELVHEGGGDVEVSHDVIHLQPTIITQN